MCGNGYQNNITSVRTPVAFAVAVPQNTVMQQVYQQPLQSAKPVQTFPKITTFQQKPVQQQVQQPLQSFTSFDNGCTPLVTQLTVPYTAPLLQSQQPTRQTFTMPAADVEIQYQPQVIDALVPGPTIRVSETEPTFVTGIKNDIVVQQGTPTLGTKCQGSQCVRQSVAMNNGNRK